MDFMAFMIRLLREPAPRSLRGACPAFFAGTCPAPLAGCLKGSRAYSRPPPLLFINLSHLSLFISGKIFDLQNTLSYRLAAIVRTPKSPNFGVKGKMFLFVLLSYPRTSALVRLPFPAPSWHAINFPAQRLNRLSVVTPRTPRTTCRLRFQRDVSASLLQTASPPSGTLVLPHRTPKSPDFGVILRATLRLPFSSPQNTFIPVHLR